jgi:hypothetical protein
VKESSLKRQHPYGLTESYNHTHICNSQRDQQPADKLLLKPWRRRQVEFENWEKRRRDHGQEEETFAGDGW